MKLLLFCIFIIYICSISSLVYADCPTGFYPISPNKCKSLTHTNIITTAFCVNNDTNSPSQAVSNTDISLDDPCPDYPVIQLSGDSQESATGDFLFNECTVPGGSNIVPFTRIGQIGQCVGGPFQLYSNALHFNETHRFFVMSYCNVGSGYQVYGEAATTPSPSVAMQNRCADQGLSSIGGFISLDFGITVCANGYQGYALTNPCLNIDECSSSTLNNCTGISTCTDNEGSFSCTCPPGYTVINGNDCQDNNECTIPGVCGTAFCTNLPGTYSCYCNNGYKLGVDGKSCVDINECTDTPNICGSATCENQSPNYECTCQTGYEFNAVDKSCVDINECIENPSICGTALCNDTNGSYQCYCQPGFKLGVDGESCIDINECTEITPSICGNALCNNDVSGNILYECYCSPNFNLTSNGKSCIGLCEITNNPCGDNTKCLITDNTTIDCECLPGYNRVSPLICKTPPSITSFYSKPDTELTYIVEGLDFGSIPNEISIKIGTVNCQYQTGTTTKIQCLVNKGNEIIGNVIVTVGTLESIPFYFTGSPYITTISELPNTTGQLITLSGRNFPSISIEYTINIDNIDCPLISKSQFEIVCNITNGSGNFKYVQIKSLIGITLNTDPFYIQYKNPFIGTTSKVYSGSGGTLTISGTNFGLLWKDKTEINIGSYQCTNIKLIESHTSLTCDLLLGGPTFSNVIDLTIDGLPVSNIYYFSFSNLDNTQCESNCIDHGKCTPTGCECNTGYTGIACNETLSIINPKPPKDDNGNGTPIIIIGGEDEGTPGGGDLSEFKYEISIVRIEELNFNQDVITTIELLEKKWDKQIDSDGNSWVYNITLEENKAVVMSSFEYFKSSKNISITDDTSIIIGAESLKLSVLIKQWPFKTKLNTLRIIFQTETISTDPDNECSINVPTINEYNQHLWTTIENSQSGIVTRFLSIAQVDGIEIIANVKPVSSSPLDKKTISLIGCSVPYFHSEALIDPDFSVLLNVDNKQTGNCSSGKSTNWQVAVGVSIGGVALIAIVVSSIYIYKDKKMKLKFKKMIKLKGIN